MPVLAIAGRGMRIPFMSENWNLSFSWMYRSKHCHGVRLSMFDSYFLRLTADELDRMCSEMRSQLKQNSAT